MPIDPVRRDLEAAAYLYAELREVRADVGDLVGRPLDEPVADRLGELLDGLSAEERAGLRQLKQHTNDRHRPALTVVQDTGGDPDGTGAPSNAPGPHRSQSSEVQAR